MQLVTDEFNKLHKQTVKVMSECETLEELQAAKRKHWNAFVDERDKQQMPLRANNIEAKRLEEIGMMNHEVEEIYTSREPTLIQDWVKRYSKRVEEERNAREKLTREVLEMLPEMYSKFKQLYDIQEELKADNGQAQRYAWRGYNAPRSSGFSLPWGKPPEHVSTEREVISAYLFAALAGALQRGMLSADGVDVDAVFKHIPLFTHSSEQRRVTGTA